MRRNISALGREKKMATTEVTVPITAQRGPISRIGTVNFGTLAPSRELVTRSTWEDKQRAIVKVGENQQSAISRSAKQTVVVFAVGSDRWKKREIAANVAGSAIPSVCRERPTILSPRRVPSMEWSLNGLLSSLQFSALRALQGIDFARFASLLRCLHWRGFFPHFLWLSWESEKWPIAEHLQEMRSNTSKAESAQLDMNCASFFCS